MNPLPNNYKITVEHKLGKRSEHVEKNVSNNSHNFLVDQLYAIILMKNV